MTTGFGKFSDVVIPRDKLQLLQRNLVESHAAGVGELLPSETVRALMLLRANCLACGFSGVRRETVELLLAMLAAGIHPHVPSPGLRRRLGRPGAPGAPGEGGDGRGGRRVPRRGPSRRRRRSRPRASRPAVFEAKEGLALINGTQLTTSVGGLALARLLSLAEGGRPRHGAHDRRAEGDGRRVRRADPRGAAAPGAGRLGREPARAPRRFAAPREPPRLRDRPGRLRPALRAAGARDGPRRRRARAPRRRRRR